MVTQQYKRAVGVFRSREQAEDALNALRNSGFSMNRVSVLAKDTSRNEEIAGVDVQNRNEFRDSNRAEDRGDNESQEGAGVGAVTGTALGGIGGLLVGLEALVIPGVGPFLAGGTIATTLAGAGIGAAAGAIVGALTGLGIPEEDAKAYNEQVSQGDYLVMLEGTDEEINRAGSILSDRGIHDWNIYNMSGDRYDSGVATTDVNRETQRYTASTDRNVVDPTTTSNSDADVVIVDRREESR
ncbi:signal transduction histidine kinase LytS [Chroococcidiopsis sp. FACHB-1243]|uniref:general stress protein n=1 Tax=Chroococcidiopsis sp. [FACHB-1243] TaxID=2692781 RepID=UPI0017831433|nr:general stress protein [Chroococcidiopsis sp. [FACHB-1243]]MBD2307721.1 signal transduction histidine kinase LytS [Chroococcidiopsis sp. [FACHB-1243]]